MEIDGRLPAARTSEVKAVPTEAPLIDNHSSMEPQVGDVDVGVEVEVGVGKGVGVGVAFGFPWPAAKVSGTVRPIFYSSGALGRTWSLLVSGKKVAPRKF